MKHQLEFEKPIVELQRKLDELKKHPETLGLNFDEEVAQIEKKIAEILSCHFHSRRADMRFKRALICVDLIIPLQLDSSFHITDRSSSALRQQPKQRGDINSIAFVLE
jgi:hypothetical protein